VSKSIRSISLVAFALCLSGTLAHAQDADLFFGAGFATDSSANSVSTLLGTPLTSPKLSGTFGKVGGDFMITKRFGFGVQTDFQFASVNYQGFQTRPIFYDFNGIYTPTFSNHSRIVPELEAGIGGVKMTFNYTSSSCDTLVGCTSSTTPIEAASHFQVHVAAGIRFYATKHLFIRPQVDYRYVPNFIQYGSNNVPEFGAAVGWSFSEH
jgi:hypothetical protein